MLLNTRHLQRFDRYVRRYAKMFASEFEISIIPGIAQGHEGAYATVYFDREAMMAYVRLNMDWTDFAEKPTDKMLRKVALHEVLHLLLSRMADNLDVMYNRTFVNGLEHEIIAKLIPTIGVKGDR